MKTYLQPAGLLMAALLTLTGCGKKKSVPEHEIPEIDVARARVDSVILHNTYPGYLHANLKVDVVAQVSGRLIGKNFEPGTYVNKGRVLFTIDPTLYKDVVSRAEASLASAISTRDYAKSHYAAVKKAFEADAVSKMEVLSAESVLNQAEADIKECQAALHTARVNLGYCTITAPVSGYISDNDISLGNYIDGGASPVSLVTIYDNSSLVAVFEIEDHQYEKMVGGNSGINNTVYRSIPLKFSGNLAHDYSADLFYQSPSVSQSTGTLVLKGIVQNPHNELKDGMYVTVSLPYGEKDKAVIVNDASIGTDQLGRYLYVVNDSNKVVYTPVEVGELYRDSLRIVTKGIEGGARYVTKALLTVRNGETVKPILRK